MKIHGTAKGAALSTKDFGVAFGGAGAASLSDEKLKAYWKFNEPSGNIINVSESDDDLGSGANITMLNGTYEQTGTPADLGNAVDFNGSDSSGICGTSTSQFDFMHNQTAEFTVAWWMKATATPDEDFLMDTAYTEGTQVGFKIMAITDMKLQFLIVRGVDGTRVLSHTTADNFIPDTDSWHFYTWSFDYLGSSPQAIFRRDNANEETADIYPVAASTNPATYPLHIASRSGLAAQFGSFEACEWSIWNKIVSDADQSLLYNDSDGREIY